MRAASVLRIFAPGCLTAMIAVCGASSPAAELPDTIGRVKPSIVGIATVQKTRRPPLKLLATGFVVADGRHAITNAHSVPESIDSAGGEQLAVITSGRQLSVRPASVISSDKVHDLAVLQFEGSRMPAMRLGDSRLVREGEMYVFTGFPIGMVLGMRPVTHRGMISAITPIAIPQISPKLLDPKMIRQLRDPYEVFQLDATAYPGNSGSPLYDPETAAVIGVINKVFVKESKEAVLEKPSGITYAIPAEYVAKLLLESGLGSP